LVSYNDSPGLLADGCSLIPAGADDFIIYNTDNFENFGVVLSGVATGVRAAPGGKGAKNAEN